MENDKQYNESYTSLIRLLFHAKESKNAIERQSITVFIGAGCSLSSSKKDISTYGILKRICQSHSENTSDDWTYIYRKFVNEIWDGCGEKDKIQLLKEYFSECKPSQGYIYLRKLIDIGCIGNIITTNFDLLIDEVLAGLSYKLQIGTTTKIIGENPTFTLIKAHGDLVEGQLRFSPVELLNLPPEISKPIKEISNTVMLVIGCRGQDNGIIQALDASSDHCAFWAAPNKPNELDKYETGPLYKWMLQRNSINNFIYGENGTFDSLMKYLYDNLKKDEDNKTNELIIWDNTYITQCFLFNTRIQTLFVSLINIMNTISIHKAWPITYPYYSESLKSLMICSHKLMNDATFKEELVSLITNEIEALLFAVTIEIYIRCYGNLHEGEAFHKELKAKYDKTISISEKFWEVIFNILLSNTDISTKSKEANLLSFIFDHDKCFQLSLEKPKIHNLYKLFNLFKIRLLFLETAAYSKEPKNALKRVLELKFNHSLKHNNNTTIYLTGITEKEYQNMHRFYLNNFEEHLIGTRFILSCDDLSLYVDGDIIEENKQFFSLYDEMLHISEKLTNAFFQARDFNSIYVLEMYGELDSFMESKNPLFVLTGPAGSGKTTMLSYWAHSYKNNSTIFLPYEAYKLSYDKNNDEFLKSWIDNPDLLIDINRMLQMRNENLVIMFDALNEMKFELTIIIKFFNTLIDISRFIIDNNLFYMKIVVSMRLDFYEKLKDFIDLDKPSAIFYQSLSNSTPSMNHIIFRLDKMEIRGILKQKFYLQRQEISQISKHLSDLPFEITPHVVEIIADNYIKNKDFSNSFFQLEKAWLNERLIEEQDISDIGYPILNSIIKIKYFNRQNYIRLQDILNEMLNYDYRKIIAALQALEQKRIISMNNTLLDIKYDHIAEYLLAIELIKTDINGIIDIVLNFNNNPVVFTSVKHFINHLYERETLLDIAQTIRQIIDYHDTSVTSTIVKIMIYISKESKKADITSKLLLMMNSSINPITFADFIKEIIFTYNSYCEHNEIVPEALLKIIQDIVPLDLKGYYEYVYANYLLSLSNDERDIYAESFAHCEKAECSINQATFESLIDDIKSLKAILLRYKGQLNDAATLLEEVTERQRKMNQYDAYCKHVLQLGAILRELTEFDKAISLYELVPLDQISNTILKNRIYMNKGIILKNKLQLLLAEKPSLTKMHQSLYENALSLFQTAYVYSKDSNDIPFQLEMLCEMIEISEIGYKLHYVDISVGEGYVREMKSIIDKYPVPVRRIQALRMEARITALYKDKLTYTVEILKKGKEIAVEYNIPFRAADCCNQLSSLVIEHIDDHQLNIALITDALACLEYSINYYTSLNNPNHKYLKHELKKRKILSDYYQKICEIN